MSITCVLTEKESLQDFIARSESTLQKETEDEDHVRHAELVIFDNCSKGLGVKICGGCSLNGEEDYGIFIKRILPGGLADLDGRLQKGDQILEVNKESLEGVTNERAVAILRQASASNHVEIIVARDDQARCEFREILEKSNGFSFPCTPVPLESQNSNKSESFNKPSKQKENLQISSTQNKEENLIKRNQQLVITGRCPPNASIEIQEHRITPTEGADTVNMHSPIRHPTKALLLPSMTSTPHAKGTSHLSYSSLSQEMPSPVTVPSSSSFDGTTRSVFETKSPSNLPNYWTMSHSKKLSLDPLETVKVENCEMALCYLGLEPTPEQQIELRSRLQVDANGTVVYGDFVNAARDVFQLQLEEKNIQANALFFADSNINEVADPPAYKSEAGAVKSDTSNLSNQQERDELKEEIEHLKTLLREKEGASRKAEEETLKIRLKAQEAIQLSRSLRSKFHLAEQAQQVARDVEQDYEEVVHLLEREVAQLQAQLNKQRLSDPVMQRRLAVLTCQLQKSEARQKVYEVAVEKLLQFAEHVHETLNEQSESLGTKSTGNLGEAPRGTCPPGYLGKHKGQSSKSLATEAREIVKTVKAVIDNQPLPFGWEEAYTSDGMKYYINHLNQLTTWSHPMSSVQHLPTVKDEKKSTNPDRSPDQPS